MKTIEKRQKRAQILKEANEILDLAEKENRSLTQEETVKYDQKYDDASKLMAEIEREERHAETMKGLETRTNNEFKPNSEKMEKRDKNVDAAFRSYLFKGEAGLTNEERSILMERRAQSTTDSALGGYTVAPVFYNQLQEAQKNVGGVRLSKATILNTATGADLSMPSANETAAIGAIIAENTPVVVQDVNFGLINLGSYTFTSNTILVPMNLIQDSSFDIEAYVAKAAGERIGRSQNKLYTTGTGTAQPQGVITGATLGRTAATGHVDSLTYDDLVELTFALDATYRQNAEIMLNDQTLKAIAKMVDSQGRPLWRADLTGSVPDSIMGYKYVINNDMPVMGAGAKSIVFGDLSKYMIRDVSKIEIYRIADKYIESRQIGFVAYARSDAKVIDAGTHPIVYFQNSEA